MKPFKTDIPAFRRRINYTLRNLEVRKYILSQHIGGGYMLIYNRLTLQNYIESELIAQQTIIKQLAELNKFGTYQLTLNI